MSSELQQKIEGIFYPYVGIYSESGSAQENQTAEYVRAYFDRLPYFRDHPEQFGLYAIEGDFHGRSVAWALVKGHGRRTVVLMHHFDVVEVEDYGLLKPLAFRPAELEQGLREHMDLLSAEARADLLSGKWLFGRGTADMKGGGSIQIALMDALSRETDFDGNVVLVAVPDEENLSVGMRAAVRLLAELKERYGFEYVMMINSEPHIRKDPEVGTFPVGSGGKVMPFVYVRGVLAHVGMSPTGFNPLAILGDVIRRTEMNMALTRPNDTGEEVSVPPSWLMARDSKFVYDVSMPQSAFGCLNVLMLRNHPELALREFTSICEQSAAEVTAQINQAADGYRKAAGIPQRANPVWKTPVLMYDEFLARMQAARPEAYEAAYRKALEASGEAVLRGEKTTAAATWAMLDQLAHLGDPNQPLVVVGLLPPFYPSVSHLDRPEFKDAVLHLTGSLNNLAQREWGQHYDLEIYMGITDLSYSSLSVGEDVVAVIAKNMPLFGRYYNIPFEEMSAISMPCVNIGPQGKDFHQLTERVLKEDLFERTPRLVRAAVRAALDWRPG